MNEELSHRKIAGVTGHAARAHAMRIAHRLANFDVEGIRSSEYLGQKGLRAKYSDAPEPRKWPYIDLDPLLGTTEEFLIDDGCRATWPVDHAFCIPVNGEDGADWRIIHGRTIELREARKMSCRVFSPKMMRIEQVTFSNGVFSFGDVNISLVGGKWADAQRGPISSIKDMRGGRNGSDRVYGVEGDLISGAALRLRYEWSAVFSFPNGMNLRFGTSAAGALAIFRDREKGEGETRRSPLLHWVRRHWRRGKSTAEALREIRKYLRGKEHIEWHGLPVTLIPSEYEMDQMAA